MPHEDFFLASLIEFTKWEDGKEKTIVKYNKFEELPSHLIQHFKNNSESELSLMGINWKVLEISRDLRAHGKGIHVKVRLDQN